MRVIIEILLEYNEYQVRETEELDDTFRSRVLDWFGKHGRKIKEGDETSDWPRFYKEIDLPFLPFNGMVFNLNQIPSDLNGNCSCAPFEVKEVAWIESQGLVYLELRKSPGWDTVWPNDLDLTIWTAGNFYDDVAWKKK